MIDLDLTFPAQFRLQRSCHNKQIGQSMGVQRVNWTQIFLTKRLKAGLSHHFFASFIGQGRSSVKLLNLLSQGASYIWLNLFKYLNLCLCF